METTANQIAGQVNVRSSTLGCDVETVQSETMLRVERMQMLGEIALDARIKLEADADRYFGPIPECDQGLEAVKANANSTLSQMDDALDILERHLRGLIENARRFDAV